MAAIPPVSPSREADEIEIKITAQMIEAGATVIWNCVGDAFPYGTESRSLPRKGGL